MEYKITKKRLEKKKYESLTVCQYNSPILIKREKNDLNYFGNNLLSEDSVDFDYCLLFLNKEIEIKKRNIDHGLYHIRI